jgi:hypothetical protein
MMPSPAAQEAWAAATAQQQFELLEHLRRIFQLSADATVEDINRALLDADSYQTKKKTSVLTSPLSLSALAVIPAAVLSPDEEVRQRLGISRDRWSLRL